MIILNENETLKIKLKDAHTTTQRDFSVAYGDSTGSILSEWWNKWRFSSTPVVMAEHPAAWQKRIVKWFTVSNNDTVKWKFIIYIDDWNNETIVHQHPLNVGESFDSLASNNGWGWMEKSTYDPNLMEADAFNMDNMNDWTTKHYATTEQVNTWNSKQDKLYSWVNLKTLNWIDLQGSWDISLDDISKVNRVSIEEFVAWEPLIKWRVYTNYNLAEGSDDIDVWKDIKRVATSITWNWWSVEDITIKVKKVWTPIADLNFRIETDNNWQPSWQLVDPDAISVWIKQSDLTSDYQEVILKSINPWVFIPSVNLSEITSNDSILWWIKFVTIERTFLKKIKVNENCSANKIYFWYTESWSTVVKKMWYYNISDWYATFDFEIPSWATCYAVCISNDLTNTITNARDINAIYPMVGKWISITWWYAYNDETLITASTTRTIYYNNNWTTTLAANASDWQKFRAKHWTKISSVWVYSDAGNLLKCEIWNEDKTVKLWETQNKNWLVFTFADPVEISKWQTFHIVLTAWETAYTNMYYYNNYASVGPTNVDLEWLSDSAWHDIWKMINNVTCLTYASENLTYNNTISVNDNTYTSDNTYNRLYNLFNNNADWTYYAWEKFEVKEQCKFKWFNLYTYTNSNYTNSCWFKAKLFINDVEKSVSRTYTKPTSTNAWDWYEYSFSINTPIEVFPWDKIEVRRWLTTGTNNANYRISCYTGSYSMDSNSTYIKYLSRNNNFWPNANPNSTNTYWWSMKTIIVDKPSVAWFLDTPAYSNIDEIDVTEEVTLPKWVKCWLVWYEWTYWDETLNASSYYKVKTNNFNSFLSKTYDWSTRTNSNKNIYIMNAPIITKYVMTWLQEWKRSWYWPDRANWYMASENYNPWDLTKLDISWYIPYLSLSDNYYYWDVLTWELKTTDYGWTWLIWKSTGWIFIMKYYPPQVRLSTISGDSRQAIHTNASVQSTNSTDWQQQTNIWTITSEVEWRWRVVTELQNSWNNSTYPTYAYLDINWVNKWQKSRYENSYGEVYRDVDLKRWDILKVYYRASSTSSSYTAYCQKLSLVYGSYSVSMPNSATNIPYTELKSL